MYSVIYTCIHKNDEKAYIPVYEIQSVHVDKKKKKCFPK